MKRTRYAVPAVIAGAALIAAGIAAAHSQWTQSTQAASADFAAATVSQARSSTCTGSDGTYQDMNAVYTGTATSTSSPQLNGALEIRAHSVVNTTEGLGWLDGTFRVRPASGGGVNASFHAAIAGTNLVGLATAGGGAKLVASLSSAFTQAGGFSSGHLGSGTATNAGVFFTQGSCTKVKQVKGTFVSRLDLNTREVVPPVTGLRASGNGNLTFDVTRDASNNVTGGTVVFYVNYDFPGSVTITGLSLHQGAKGTNGPLVIDAGTGTVTDTDGHGNLTKVVSGVSAQTLTSVLGNPHGYYVTLTTSANPNGALRDQLESPQRR